MRKILFIIIISLAINLAVLSLTYGQNNMNVSGFVPVTDFNRNSVKGKIEIKHPQPEQNQYLFWFEKVLGVSKDQNKAVSEPTDYDQIYSSLVLWILMILAAILVWLALKIFDRVVIRIKKGRQRIHRKGNA